MGAVGEQEVFMFSGLERRGGTLCRQKYVSWAWIKARGIVNSRPTPKSSMLTTSVLLADDEVDRGQARSWRDSLAAITYRALARQLCEHFYDLSIFHAWRSQMPEAVATSRMLSPALPSYCKAVESAPTANIRSDQPKRALILTAVLP